MQSDHHEVNILDVDTAIFAQGKRLQVKCVHYIVAAVLDLVRLSSFSKLKYRFLFATLTRYIQSIR